MSSLCPYGETGLRPYGETGLRPFGETGLRPYGETSPTPTVRLGRDVLSAPNSGEVVVSANLDSEAVEQLELQVVVEDLTAVGEKQRSHSNLNKEGPGC